MPTQNHNVALNLKAIQPIFDFELFKINEQDKEDVKQNAIVRILTSLADPRYIVTEETLFGFAQKIVKRTVVDYYRKLYRKIEVNSSSVNFSDGFAKDDSWADAFSKAVNESGFAVAELRVDYSMNKRKFTPQERRVVEYMLFDEDGAGMQMKEITDALGIDKSHGSRAFHKLRELVQG